MLFLSRFDGSEGLRVVRTRSPDSTDCYAVRGKVPLERLCNGSFHLPTDFPCSERAISLKVEYFNQ